MKRNSQQDEQHYNNLLSRVKKRNIYEPKITGDDKNYSNTFTSTTSEQHLPDTSNNSPINDDDLFSKFFEGLEISDNDSQHNESEPNRPSISLSSQFLQTQGDSHNSSFKFSTISERGSLPLSSENQDLKLIKPDTFRDTSLPRFSTPQQISKPDISTTSLPGFSTSQPPQNQIQPETTRRPFFGTNSAFTAK